MKAAIVLNGQPFCRRIDEEFIICADGGFDHLKERIPALIVGDMDSIKDIPNGVALERHDIEKNGSDGELAVYRARELGATEVVIYGANGGRTDHLYGNLRLLPLIRELGMTGRIAEDECDIYYKEGEFEIEGKIGATVSILPYAEQVLVRHSEGLYYPLHDLLLDGKNPSRGLSNRLALEKARVELAQGGVYLFVYSV